MGEADGKGHTMGLLKMFRRKIWLSRALEQEVYAEALAELESGLINEGLWAKALANSEGNEKKARALYIKYRARSLRDDLVLLNDLLSDAARKQRYRGATGHRKREQRHGAAKYHETTSETSGASGNVQAPSRPSPTRSSKASHAPWKITQKLKEADPATVSQVKEGVATIDTCASVLEALGATVRSKRGRWIIREPSGARVTIYSNQRFIHYAREAVQAALQSDATQKREHL